MCFPTKFFRMVIERIEKVAQQVEFVYRRPRKRNKKKLACQFKKEQISASHTVCSIDQETDFQCVNKKKNLCVCLEVIRERKWGKHLIWAIHWAVDAAVLPIRGPFSSLHTWKKGKGQVTKKTNNCFVFFFCGLSFENLCTWESLRIFVLQIIYKKKSYGRNSVDRQEKNYLQQNIGKNICHCTK